MSYSKIIANVEGIELTQEDREFLSQKELAGIILFSRNYENRQQLKRLIKDIKQINAELLICVDQEGGRVQRLTNGFTSLPPLATFGQLFEENADEALKTARRAGWLLAVELLAAEVDFSFAPVVDIDFNTSSIIGNRAFSDSAFAVTQLAAALVQGMQSAGMKCCAKHFPGHGGIAEDSHLSRATDDRSYQTLLERDLLPYREITNAYDSVMTAHISYPKVDSNIATYSKVWLQKILRKELKFKGCIFSDDLTMAGAALAQENEPNYYDRSIKSLEAGCDALIVCNDRSAAIASCKAVSDYVESRDSAFRNSQSYRASVNVGSAMRAKRYHRLTDLVSSPVYKVAKESVLAIQAAS